MSNHQDFPLRVGSGRRRRAGNATITVLIFLGIAVTSVLVLSNVALSQMRLSRRVQGHVSALALAESGVDDAQNQIETASLTYRGTGSDPNFSASAGWATLYEDFPASATKPAGQYRTVVEDIPGQEYMRKITSTGRNPLGETATLVATVAIHTRKIGSAAIMANGNVDVSGTANVNTEPFGVKHISDVFANGNVSMGGSSYVDGRLEAHGTVVGTAYYPSVSGAPLIFFPNKAETDGWQADYVTRSKATGQTINPNNLSFKDGPVTIYGNAHLTNTVSLQNSQTLIFRPNPLKPSPEDNVVYVDGDIRLTGQAVISNGVTLVVRGTVNQGGGTTYRIIMPALQIPPLPTPSILVFGKDAAGVDASATTQTLSLQGSSGSDSAGIVWAISGSIGIGGGATFRGALVASQKGAGVAVNGNYTHLYPDGLYSNEEIPTRTDVARVVEP